ncbi:MAG TPA: ParB/RepB/Spo0J family partition protein [Candidatus Competibacteraceae bacterium]|nr:ParB/RepB/Spo0J family partition protein [Candidatus Competibacteraceae bacterium]
MFFATSPDLPRIVEVDLDRLMPNPDQPRKTFDEAALQELAASIDKYGLIQPVTVKETMGDAYILVAGERRYRAHKLLGRTTIAAIVTQGNPDEIALIENLQREDLHPIEAAEALSTMMERYRYSQEELGRAIGKSRVTVNELLRLNALPAKIKAECRTSDTLTLRKSVLIELARLDEPTEQLRLWEEIKTGQLTTVRATRARKTTPAPSKPDIDKAVANGQRLVTAIKALARVRETLSDADYQRLLDLYQDIRLALDQLAPRRED